MYSKYFITTSNVRQETILNFLSLKLLLIHHFQKVTWFCLIVFNFDVPLCLSLDPSSTHWLEKINEKKCFETLVGGQKNYAYHECFFMLWGM